MTIQLPRAMDPVLRNRDLKDRIREYANIIEEYFLAYGIPVRVAEVDLEPNGIRFCLDIALGTAIDRILKHQKKLSAILAAPYNRLILETPIPGRSKIGITIPWVYPYPEISQSESTPRQPKGVLLMKISAFFFRLSKEVDGTATDSTNKLITPNPLFMKMAFGVSSSRIDMSVSIIEKTLESFGLAVQVVEIILEPESYLFCISGKTGAVNNAKDVVKLDKDLALALASPTGKVKIVAPLPDRNQIGLYLPKANATDGQILQGQNSSISKQIGPVRRIIGRWLMANSLFFFRLSEESYFPKGDLYKKLHDYEKRMHKMNNIQLIDDFNREIDKTSQSIPLASYLSAMQHEFERRDIDYSQIANYSKGLSLKEKIKLVGKKIAIDD